MSNVHAIWAALSFASAKVSLEAFANSTPSTAGFDESEVASVCMRTPTVADRSPSLLMLRTILVYLPLKTTRSAILLEEVVELGAVVFNVRWRQKRAADAKRERRTIGGRHSEGKSVVLGCSLVAGTFARSLFHFRSVQAPSPPLRKMSSFPSNPDALSGLCRSSVLTKCSAV